MALLGGQSDNKVLYPLQNMALLGGQSDNKVLYPLQNFNMMQA